MTLDAHRLRHLVRKYQRPGPRYTSYPTAAQFGPLSNETYSERLRRACQHTSEPWSVYVHIPFCRERCLFCACAVIATPRYDAVAESYLQSLRQEIELVGGQLGDRRQLAQLHIGGGTPSYLEPELLERLFTYLDQQFERTSNAEVSIELDPRTTTLEHVKALARIGVNRTSIGVQDFDRRVQSLIGREQSPDQTEQLLQQIRSETDARVNADLIYGLPGQSVERYLETIERVIEMNLDRVALYGYAHVPWMRSNQRSIATGMLPSASQRLELFLRARERLIEAGYSAIGLDHFARPADPLVQAEATGKLQRNFMGYTVRAGTDLLGFGLTAIGEVDDALVQNTDKLANYHRALAGGNLAVARGLVRSPEDFLRGRIIDELMCQHRVDRAAICAEYDLTDFDELFATELRRLGPLIDDGLMSDDGTLLRVTELGRPFVRNAAMVFDAHLDYGDRHSSTI